MKIMVVLVMSSNCYLTNTEKGQIQAYWEQGLSISYIGKKINWHKSTIKRFLKNPDKYGQKRSGIPQTVNNGMCGPFYGKQVLETR